MDYSNIALFNIMKSKLGYLSERQGILAQNIANADTPGYKAKDLKAPDFKKMVDAAGSAHKLQMSVTSPNHIAHATFMNSPYRIMNTPKTNELNPNGNNVVLEEEMAKMSGNQGEYQKVANLYSKAVSMFKTAIGNSNSGG